MRTGFDFHFALLGALLCTPLTGTAQIAPGQSFAGSPGPVGIEGAPPAGASGTPNGKLYADGTRAINEGRWPDAEGIFTKVASQHGEHSDGALYWKAYAENKQGQTKPALDTCAALGRDYPGSGWIHECGALEIEIHAKSGAPIEPKAGDDDDLKLLALNALMKKDEARALAQLQEILNSSDSSEKLKKEALFILKEHDSNTASAQQPPSTSHPSSRSIQLDVVVTAKSGQPAAAELEERDFALLDNNSPQTITSFKAVSMGQEPVEVILLLDTVNADVTTVSFERGKVQNFLQANGGHLAYSTSIAVLTDKGVQIDKSFSTNGKELSDELGHYAIGLREISRGTQRGGWDRFTISLNAIRQLAAYAAPLPGRKIILWISPGWPSLPGFRDDLIPQEQQWIFGNVVSLSTELRQAGVTLYNIDTSSRVDHYYEIFLKGINKPGQTAYADLGLQVLAIQSGGLALESDTEVQSMIKKCFADIASWYEITFTVPAADQPNQYHDVQIKLDKPGLTARTRDGYYAQP